MVRSLACRLKYAALCLTCAAVLMSAHAPQALAADLNVYEEGGIGTTYTTYFQDILDGYTVPQDYVYFRSGQYQYYLVVGDLELNGSTFTADEYDYYLITSSSGYGQNYLTLNSGSSTDLVLDVGEHLVYSNLGHFPVLIERGETYDFAILTVLVIGGCCCLLRPLFSYVYRLRCS